MKYKLITFLILSIFLINNIYALEDLGTFKQGETVRVSQICNDATYITISSITYPNSTNAVSNFNMTYFGSGEFYYNFNSTNELGRYDVKGISDGCENTFAYYFIVTPSGTLFTNALGIPLILPIFIMLLVMSFFFFFTGFVKKPEYKFTLIIIGGIFLILSIAFGIIASREVLYGFPLLYNFINSFYKIFIITLQVGAIVVPIIIMFFVIKRAFNTRGYNIIK